MRNSQRCQFGIDYINATFLTVCEIGPQREKLLNSKGKKENSLKNFNGKKK